MTTRKKHLSLISWIKCTFLNDHEVDEKDELALFMTSSENVVVTHCMECQARLELVKEKGATYKYTVQERALGDDDYEALIEQDDLEGAWP